MLPRTSARAPHAILALALCLAWAAPAPAQPPPQPQPRPIPASADQLAATLRARGNATVDIREAGGVPDKVGAPATRRAYRLALDALAKLKPWEGEKKIRFGTGGWYFDRPALCDVPDVETYSDAGAVIRTVGGGMSPFVAGVQASPDGHALTPDHWFALDGRLDATAKGRSGYRTRETHLAAWASPLNLGPPGGWGACRALTIELAIDADATPLTGRFLAGMWDHGPGPWFLRTTATQLQLQYRLDGENATRTVAVALPPSKGIVRLALQIDFAGGTALGVANGLSVAVIGAPPAGSRLAEGTQLPCLIGNQNPSAAVAIPQTDTGSGDVAWCGLRVSVVPRYQSTPVGAPASGPSDDFHRYFDIDANVLGLLPFLDNPSDVAPDRHVLVWCGISRALDTNNWASSLLVVDPAHADESNSGGGLRFRGLAITCAGPYGAALTVGSALYLNVERCNLGGDGGAQGVGTPNWRANYAHTFRDTMMSGSDVAFYAYLSMCRLENVRVPMAGRNGAVWVASSRCSVTAAMVERASAPCRSVFRADDSTLAVADAKIDLEERGQPAPGGALFISRSTRGGMTRYPVLRLTDCATGTGGAAPFVRLACDAGATPGACLVDGPLVPIASCLVEHDGWDITVRGDAPAAFPAVMDLRVTGPPVIVPPRPAAGQGPGSPATTTP